MAGYPQHRREHAVGQRVEPANQRADHAAIARRIGAERGERAVDRVRGDAGPPPVERMGERHFGVTPSQPELLEGCVTEER